MGTNLDEITTLTSLSWFAGLSCGQSTMLYTKNTFLFVSFFLLHWNGPKLGKGFGTCLMNKKVNPGYDPKRLKGPEIVTLLLHKMTTLEINGKRISSSGNVWYCTQKINYAFMLFHYYSYKEHGCPGPQMAQPSAFPPVALLPQVLRRVREQRHKLILIAPLWRN